MSEMSEMSVTIKGVRVAIAIWAIVRVGIGIVRIVRKVTIRSTVWTVPVGKFKFRAAPRDVKSIY